jgi:hypothetical protein
MVKILEAIALERTKKGPPCGLGNLLAHIPEEEQTALLSLINPEAYPRTTSTALARAIESAYGERIGRNAIDRHRRGDCSCGWRFEK